MRFTAFLTESTINDHIEHVEDHVFQGESGFNHAKDTLEAVNNRLRGEPSQAKVSTKFDGSPAIVFGHHGGKFFVGTKSVFSKKPKLMFSDADIERKYGDKPALAFALKSSLSHLRKVTPDKGIYQGDLMYTSRDKHEDDTHFHFTPNTIMYSARKTDPEGGKIKNAKIGVVVHTKYHGKDLHNMYASHDLGLGLFKKNKDVHIINPELSVKSPVRDEEANTKFKKHMHEAEKVIIGAPAGAFEDTKIHAANLRQYVNQTVRNDEVPTAQGFKAFMTRTFKKEIDVLKTPAGKSKKQAALIAHLSHIDDHHDHYHSILTAHGKLQQAKEVLMNVMKDDGEYETSIDGVDSEHEGYVVHHHGTASKLVNRAEFSKANFAKHDKKS
jgi:hypothetical protein